MTIFTLCGLCIRAFVKSICGLCRFGFDESHPRSELIGTLSVSSVGYLMGDLFPFGRCGVSIASVEDDPNPEEVDGVPMGAIETLALFLRLSTCGWGRRARCCGMWG